MPVDMLAGQRCFDERPFMGKRCNDKIVLAQMGKPGSVFIDSQFIARQTHTDFRELSYSELPFGCQPPCFRQGLAQRPRQENLAGFVIYPPLRANQQGDIGRKFDQAIEHGVPAGR
jgi:hypothetical protein